MDIIKEELTQCELCNNYISCHNLLRHKRTKKCIRLQISNHLDKFWDIQKEVLVKNYTVENFTS